MEDTITLTQAEFDAKVEEAVKSATDELVKKHNKEMYDSRQEIKKLKDASLSKEELEAKVRQEQDEATQKELTELRAYKKQSILTDKLAKEGLPSYFKNDRRLLDAEDGDLDKVIKTVKKEYDDSLPKGSSHSTVINTGGSQPQISEKDKANAEMGKALTDLVRK